MAHLAYAKDSRFESCAEFGVSVLESARGCGFGTRLFERAARHCSNGGIQGLFIHALSENAVMLNIARKAGARIDRDGTESEAFLSLPPATLDSQMTEIIEEQMAVGDYRMKLQAKQFADFLTNMQIMHRSFIAPQAQIRYP